VPAGEKLRRLQVLNDSQQRFQARRNAARVGRTEEVLVDTIGERGRVSGRTPDFRIVHFDGGASDLGRLVPVRTDASGPNSLSGRRLDIPVAVAAEAPIL